MASTQEFVDYVVDQFDSDCGVTAKKMFGEYGLFSRGKMFGLVCDDRLFIKPTDAGRALIGTPDEAPPYPGARPCLLIGDEMENGPWLSELVRITTTELPEPRKRRRTR